MQALEHLGQLGDAAADVSPGEALKTIRQLQLQVGAAWRDSGGIARAVGACGAGDHTSEAHRAMRGHTRGARTAHPRSPMAVTTVTNATVVNDVTDVTTVTTVTDLTDVTYIAQVSPDAKVALLRSPPQLAQHQQAAYVQTLMRSLLARARGDGSFAPLQYEEVVGGAAS